MKEKFDKLFSDNRGEVPQEVLLRYVSGTATPEEQRWVEERLADDSFLSDAVEGMMKAGNVVNVKQDLETIHEEIKAKSSGKLRTFTPWKRWLQVAAALAFLISSIWFINNRIQQSTEKIFTEEFEPYPVPRAEQSPPVGSDVPSNDEKQFIPPLQNTTPEKKEGDKVEKATAIQNESISATKAEEVETPASYITQDLESVVASPEEDQNADVAFSESKKSEYVSDSIHTISKTKTISKDNAQPPSVAAPQSLSEVVVTQQKKQANAEGAMKQDTDGTKPMLNDALDWYHQENYPEAISRFELILQQDANNDAANFYAGVSYLTINNPDKALEKLKKLDNKKEGTYYEATLWYESLAYVQKGEKKNAINTLEKVVKLNGEYRIKAEQLLKQLK